MTKPMTQSKPLCPLCKGFLDPFSASIKKRLHCFNCYNILRPRDCKEKICPDLKSAYWDWHLKATPGECRYPHCCKNHHDKEDILAKTISNEEAGIEWAKKCVQCENNFPYSTKGCIARTYNYLSPEKAVQFMKEATLSEEKMYLAMEPTDDWNCSIDCKDAFIEGRAQGDHEGPSYGSYVYLHPDKL